MVKYIGKDIHNNEKYLGSGMLLCRAIKKYGKCNFKKIILEFCDSIEKLNNREKYWIKKLKSTKRNIGYNIAVGGYGGDTVSNNPNYYKWLNKKRGKIPWNKGKTGIFSDETLQKISRSKKRYFENNPEKKINAGTFKSGKDHVLYGKKRDRNIVEKIMASRLKSGGYKSGSWNAAHESCKKKILVIDSLNNINTIYNSIGDASIALNIPRGTISCKLRKKYKINRKKIYKHLIFEYYKEKNEKNN